ncbi:MAG: 2OG-Fe(II) oxygenase [Alphaproteobacteria bacterium]|jgi:hypothetical protein|nr:2OG-Fe(II) oxygenase [Alphaproteobacteria bacterium]
MTGQTIGGRIDALPWAEMGTQLAERGYARAGPLLTPTECQALVRLFGDDRRFRSTVEMARHRFGEGRYRYFAYPLPRLVGDLRRQLYPRLVPIANAMMAEMRRPHRYPGRLEEFLSDCRAAGQCRPTPLLLGYEAGGYNRLHRDLYGELLFPLQAVLCLSRPGRDFEGGEFLLVEQSPRMQARAEAIRPGQGEIVVFPTAERPVAGKRGFHRAQMRHGVSRVQSGHRHTLGIIFHDAA